MFDSRAQLIGDLGVDGRIILKWILKIGLGGRGRNFYGSGQEKVLGSCESNKKINCSIKCGTFLDGETVSFQEGMCFL